MLQSWKLGRLFNIDIWIHWSFVLVPLMVAFSTLQAGALSLLPYMLALVLTLFGCVVLHELGHALAARRYGIPTRDITLYPIGGVARLEQMPERPSAEFWIAIAGPAVNVAIVLLLWPLTGGIPLTPQGNFVFPSGEFVFDLLCLNAWLVLFNMLPAFPSDGGRVLRAVLAMFMSRVRATEIATWVGVAAAVGFAFYFHTVSAIAVAAFLIFVGQQELAAVRSQSQREAEPLTVLPADAVPHHLIPDIQPWPGGQGYSGVLWDTRLRAWVLWRNGRPVHVVE